MVNDLKNALKDVTVQDKTAKRVQRDSDGDARAPAQARKHPGCAQVARRPSGAARVRAVHPRPEHSASIQRQPLAVGPWVMVTGF